MTRPLKPILVPSKLRKFHNFDIAIYRYFVNFGTYSHLKGLGGVSNNFLDSVLSCWFKSLWMELIYNLNIENYYFSKKNCIWVRKWPKNVRIWT